MRIILFYSLTPVHLLYPFYKEKEEELGPVSQNSSSVTIAVLCYKLPKSLLLIGYKQICHWFLSFVIEKMLCKTIPWGACFLLTGQGANHQNNDSPILRSSNSDMNFLDEENMSFKPSSLWLKALYAGNCCKKMELVSNSCSDKELFHKNPSGYSDVSSNNYVNVIGMIEVVFCKLPLYPGYSCPGKMSTCCSFWWLWAISPNHVVSRSFNSDLSRTQWTS